MIKNILITGGCGFVGSNIGIFLKKKGFKITSLDNLYRKGSSLNLERLKKAKIKNLKININNFNSIIKINQNSKITYKSGNLSVLVPEKDFQVISLKEKNRNLFVVTPSKLLIIDQFGSLLKTLNLSAKKGLIIKEDDLISYDGKYIYK